MNTAKLSLAAFAFVSALTLLPRLAFATTAPSASAGCTDISGTYVVSADAESRTLIRYEQNGCATLTESTIFQQLDAASGNVVNEEPPLPITSVIDGTDDCSKQSPCFAIYEAYRGYMLKRVITPRMRASDSDLPGCRFTDSRLMVMTNGDLVEQLLPDTCSVDRLTGHGLPSLKVYKRLK